MQQTAPTAGYEIDFALWAQTQAAALREGRFADLDLPHLLEEIDDLSGSLRREIRSRIKQIAAHLLKSQYQTKRATPSWETTIRVQVSEIDGILEDSPSLRREMPEFIATGYCRGRKLASIETELPLATFPQTPTPEFERALRAALVGDDFES
jgi:hypothetical protein